MIVQCGGCRLGFDEAKSARCPRCGGEPMGGDPISAEGLSEVEGEVEVETTSRSMPLALRSSSSSAPQVAPPAPGTAPAPRPPPYSIQVVVQNQVHVPAAYAPPSPYPYPPPQAYGHPYAQPYAAFPPYAEGPTDAFYPAPYVRRKDPGAATLLSCVVPGVGQLYNGQVRKGLAFLALTCINVVLLFVGIGVFTGLVTWIWAMADAHNSAEKINRGQIVV